MAHSTTTLAQHLWKKYFVHELPKMDSQDQFVAVNVTNISPTEFRKKINSDAKFLEKKTTTTKVMLTMVPKECALNYTYKLVVSIRLASKIFHKMLRKEHYRKVCFLKNLSQSHEISTLNQNQMPLLTKGQTYQDRIFVRIVPMHTQKKDTKSCARMVAVTCIVPFSLTNRENLIHRGVWILNVMAPRHNYNTMLGPVKANRLTMKS